MQFSFFQNADDETANRFDGFRYQPALIEQDAEERLIECVQELPFQEFDFHGYKGKRRVVSFGWKYEFSGGGQLKKAEDIPEFLLDLRWEHSILRVDKLRYSITFRTMASEERE